MNICVCVFTYSALAMSHTRVSMFIVFLQAIITLDLVSDFHFHTHTHTHTHRNKKYRQALASGSADMTVKIWDVTTQACQHTFTHHTDKVRTYKHTRTHTKIQMDKSRYDVWCVQMVDFFSLRILNDVDWQIILIPDIKIYQRIKYNH